MPAALQTARIATRCTPDRRTKFSAAVRIAAMVASERRLRLRRRAGRAGGVGAGAAARCRDSRATVDAFVVSTEDLDRTRFLVDTGAFIKSLIPCSSVARFCAKVPEGTLMVRPYESV